MSSISGDGDRLGAVFAIPPKEMRPLRPRQVYDVQARTIHTLDTYGQPIASVEILSEHYAHLLTLLTETPGRLLSYDAISEWLLERTSWTPDRGGLRKALAAAALATFSSVVATAREQRLERLGRVQGRSAYERGVRSWATPSTC